MTIENIEDLRAVRRAIGSNIAAMRQAHGWTVEHCARRAGLLPTKLAKYETGGCTINLEVLARLALTLDVSLVWLLTVRTDPWRSIRGRQQSLAEGR